MYSLLGSSIGNDEIEKAIKTAIDKVQSEVLKLLDENDIAVLPKLYPIKFMIRASTLTSSYLQCSFHCLRRKTPKNAKTTNLLVLESHAEIVPQNNSPKNIQQMGMQHDKLIEIL